MAEAFRRVERQLFDYDVAFGKRDTAGFRRGVNGKDHWESWYTRSAAYAFPLAFNAVKWMLRTAGKLAATDAGTTKVPGDPVPNTRMARPSVTTSPLHRNIIARVARVWRVSFTANCTGLPGWIVLPAGASITNGIFFTSVSISCTGTGRDSNL